jgi:hypothetical protein
MASFVIDESLVGKDKPQTPKDKPVTWYVKAAGVAFLSLFVSIIGGLTIVNYWMGWLISLGHIASFALFVALLGGGWVGFRWTREAVERPWRQEDEDRAPALAEKIVEVTEPIPDGYQLERIGYLMICRYYIDKQATTRKQLEQANVCTQQEFKRVHAAMVAAHIRTERGKWMKDDLHSALTAWYRDVAFDADGGSAMVWKITSGSRSGKRIRFGD